jgi:hypothetical protein
MPAELVLSDLFKSVVADAAKAVDAAGGALGDDVYVQFICSTENGFDPDSPPDDRVRASHAAFHGQIFRLADAPVPPLDYGCRCAIRYVAKPDTKAAEVLDETASEDPTTPIEATEAWLEEFVPQWRTLSRSAAAATKKEAITSATLKAKELGISDPRMIAEMVVDVLFGKRRANE